MNDRLLISLIACLPQNVFESAIVVAQSCFSRTAQYQTHSAPWPSCGIIERREQRLADGYDIRKVQGMETQPGLI